MKRIAQVLLAATAVFVLPSIARADGITISVTPWLAPNAYGSPSYAEAVQNAVTAERTGVSSYGNPGPTQFNAQTSIVAAQGVVTSFPSWMGQADPTGAYANELGNRMAFAIAINGNGTQFSISQLSFQTNDSGYGLLNYSLPASSYTYNSGYVGVLKGKDGILGTADDVYITSGDSTQLVDALYGRGTGVSLAADGDYCALAGLDCTTYAGQQEAINDVASFYPDAFTGTYTLTGNYGTVTGTGQFDISQTAPTPEPSSLLLLGTGISGIAGLARRKFRKA